MCTIYTFTNDLYTNEMITRIEQDFQLNNDGCSLLLDNGLFLQTLNIDDILNVLATVQWNRCWLHLRAASTSIQGLGGCHGFYTRDRQYLVFHNGVLDNYANLPVDSMQIADLIDSIGVDATLDFLSDKFANTFIVNTKDFHYYVGRGVTGSLFTDNKGNFSTLAVDDIKIPVQHCWSDLFDWIVPSWRHEQWGIKPLQKAK